MSSFQVCRKHDLDEQECRAVAEKLLNKLVGKFGGKYAENGDNFSYKHTAGVNALVEAKDGELLVNVKLGMMTRALAPQLKSEMTKVLDDYFSG